MIKLLSSRSIRKRNIIISKMKQKAVCGLAAILIFAAIATGCTFRGAETVDDTETDTNIITNTTPVETAQEYIEEETFEDDSLGLTPDEGIIEEAEGYPYETDFYGYISGISESCVSVDEIIWDTKGDYDNGYAIINDDTDITEYTYTSDCQFWILEDYWCPCQRLEYEVFAEFLSEGDSTTVWVFALNEDGEVVMIGMQYQP